MLKKQCKIKRMIFTHPKILTSIPQELLMKYEENVGTKPFEIFCQKCYRMTNHVNENSYEDQVIKIILLKYFFLT